jgi:hypothetical protein
VAHSGFANLKVARLPYRPSTMFALQPEMKVFSGSANRELAERICKFIGIPLGAATISSTARLTSKSKRTCVVATFS